MISFNNIRAYTLYLFEKNFQNMPYSMARDLKYIFKDSDRINPQESRLMPSATPGLIQNIMILWMFILFLISLFILEGIL